MEIEHGVPLARLTTIGTGGPAAALARPTTLAELEQAVGWAAERGLAVVTIGLGSNVLGSDAGVDALVVRLEGELASVSIDGEALAVGGGATNAVCLHRARAAGLGGLEFACRGETTAPPIRWPLSPQSSIIRPAPSSPGGFLKTEPNVRLLVGCVALRRATSSATSALISAGGRGASR